MVSFGALKLDINEGFQIKVKKSCSHLSGLDELISLLLLLRQRRRCRRRREQRCSTGRRALPPQIEVHDTHGSPLSHSLFNWTYFNFWTFFIKWLLRTEFLLFFPQNIILLKSLAQSFKGLYWSLESPHTVHFIMIWIFFFIQNIFSRFSLWSEQLQSRLHFSLFKERFGV